LLVFFFFQAEDGIRDATVTGVQTCALPILGVRISLSDFVPNGLDIEDALRVAQELERDGRIDYVNVTAAGYHNIWRAIEPSDVPDGYLVELTAQVKASLVRLPVFTVGGIKD